MDNATSSAPHIKQEFPLLPRNPNPNCNSYPTVYIDLSSSGSDSEVENSHGGGDDEAGLLGSGKRSRRSDGSRKGGSKKYKALPVGFLDPLPTIDKAAPKVTKAVKECKQFWKAGDYDGSSGFEDSLQPTGVGMDHVRVHPKFLHSNATSHKWALGAFAELFDNSLDEACHGATFVNIDVMQNKKDGTKMLLVEDNGGGMDPDNMRKCMSLGYSVKNKIANTIGQYGNGFKTSTMRLGADVIVFSRSRGKDGKSPTQSIGMLSYTFLRNTRKEDIVVPMLDYEKVGHVWNKVTRSSSIDWNLNVETIIQWSPYSSEAELLQQFNSVSEQGTRIIIFNLWDDDQGELELDFDTDKEDIQLGGANRDELKVEMASQFPNSKHFLTYHHSLRSYASILYLRVPSGFRMILRGKEIENHKLVNDMMLKETVHYSSRDSHAVTDVTMGFVKDAEHHIDIQGFNVYHKNRLIKPFWRVWNAAGSDGRGVIGVLEANFVEPAHDKQGFEMTTVLRRLESRLVQMQKTYWYTRCHRIGYAPRRSRKQIAFEERESSPEPHTLFTSGKTPPSSGRGEYSYRTLPRSNTMGKSGQPSSRVNSDYGLDTDYIPPSSGRGKYSYQTLPRSNTMEKSGEPSSRVNSDYGLDTDYIPPISGRGKYSYQNLPRSNTMEKSGQPSSRVNSDCGLDTDYIPSRKSTAYRSARPVISSQKYSHNKTSQPTSSPSPLYTDKIGGLNHTSDGVEDDDITARSQLKLPSVTHDGSGQESKLQIQCLIDENDALKKKIIQIEQTMSLDLQQERQKNASMSEQLKNTKTLLEESSSEQATMLDIFAAERNKWEKEEIILRKKLMDASHTIQDLLTKLSASGGN